MTLAISIMCLSRSEHGFSSRELREFWLDDRAPIPAHCRSMICDSATGKLYIVTETNAGRGNSELPGRPESVAPEPSKFIYFEYFGRAAPTPHIVKQMEYKNLSREECSRVLEAYRVRYQNDPDCPMPSDSKCSGWSRRTCPSSDSN